MELNTHNITGTFTRDRCWGGEGESGNKGYESHQQHHQRGGFGYRTRDITVLGRLLLTSVYRGPVGGDEV